MNNIQELRAMSHMNLVSRCAALQVQLKSYRNGTLEARVKELEADNERLAKQFVDMKSYADYLEQHKESES